MLPPACAEYGYKNLMTLRILKHIIMYVLGLYEKIQFYLNCPSMCILLLFCCTKSFAKHAKDILSVLILWTYSVMHQFSRFDPCLYVARF